MVVLINFEKIRLLIDLWLFLTSFAKQLKFQFHVLLNRAFLFYKL
jgi:hypothetical protein